MSDRINFLNGVSQLHAHYTENVRLLARAYNLRDEEAAQLLDGFGYHNVARNILVKRDDAEEEPNNFGEQEEEMRG